VTKVYYDQDASLEPLKKRRVAIIGYGIQGRGQALNLRDSGIDVVVSQRSGGAHYEQARADGFEPVSAADAAAEADVIQMLTQDTIQPQIYREAVAPHLPPGKALGFSHGFNIHFHQIVPPKEVDVFMVAPKGPGSLLRQTYVEGKGVPALFAVAQDATGRARQLALAYARAIGAARAGVLETTFKEETETDLFGEQSVLCGGVTSLIKAGFETLVEAGYQPEVAYFECLHELKLIVDMIYAGGITGMRQRVSETARYGDLTRGPRVVDPSIVKERMRQVLSEVQSGAFAREWILENQANRPVFTLLLKKDEGHLIEEVGRKLRGMMAWLQQDERPAAASRRGSGAGETRQAARQRKVIAKR